ncbi:permease for cytosine/purines, uracil, thiamine, allantoin-domain-containing protein [Hygrophoropsis aurantiaca]|uniref:Permease for cytosine/purines, uracil, thiamine, allantoin-domain-containing protein n=1 Tax=Hygrophoropsis aurantiaca TaxID=72124 RepID=A0ACB8ACI4_9AGAM|nr:permease for cytosine/purines, uracil, thiamine, allantoin-domain-containing protein [Hygrophoropsis aurantiaca]
MEMGDNKSAVSVGDVEKDSVSASHTGSNESDVSSKWRSQPWARALLSWGVEERGTVPVPYEQRTDTQFYKIFFVWFSMNFNILSFSTGVLGPIAFGLGIRDSCLVILFFNMLACALPAYLNTWGPKTGMRQMVLSRYTFGYYGIIIPAILNLIGLCGFNILNCILGGQALSSVTGGSMSWTVGIVIIAILAMLMSFMGIKVLNWYERVAWFPVLIAFLVALGVGGKHLYAASAPDPPLAPATSVTVLSYAAVIAGFVVTYSAMASDFTMYYTPAVPRKTIFLYSYFGYIVPIILMECLGAAAVLAAPTVPSWNTGYGTAGNIGGLLEAMLQPVGNFGKFLTVLLSLSVTGNIACTLYSICFNFQVCIPRLEKVPRYVFSIVGTAIALPLSIVGAHRFQETLTNFLSLIGYWASAYGAILIIEHHYFRSSPRWVAYFSPSPSHNPYPTSPSSGVDKADIDPYATYHHPAYDQPARLPTGISALLAGILAFGLIIPCMNQVWFVGPIGMKTGDIGFEVAFVLGGMLYVPIRWGELTWGGRRG